VSACQSPTEPTDPPDFVDVTSPGTVTADGGTGRFYSVTVNDITETREYDWKTTFTITVTLNNNATHEDVDLSFPVDLTATTVKVQQASGGIVTPPTSGENERYDFVISQTTGNRFTGVNTSVTMTFDVWYDLPNLRKEALVTATLSMTDDDGVTFTENVSIRLAP